MLMRKKPSGQPGKYAGDEPLRGQLGQKEALRRLLGELGDLKVPIAIGLAMTLVWASVNLGYGALAKGFFDTIQRYEGTGKMEELNRQFAIAMSLMVVRGLVYFVMNYAWAYASTRLTFNLRNRVFAHLQSQSISFFDKRKTGQLLSSLSNDVPAAAVILNAVEDSFAAPFVLVGGTAVLFWVNWRLALVSMVCLPPTAWLIVTASRRIQASTARVQDNAMHVLDQMEQTISAIRVVKSFGNEEYEIGRFRHHSKNVFRMVMRTQRVWNLMRPTVELLGALAILLVLWVGGREIIHNSHALTFGSLVWFVMVLKQVADSARSAGSISGNLASAGVAADRVFTLLDTKNEIREKPDAIELAEPVGRVTLEHVEFAYSTGIPVLADISFAMEPGQVVALVGPTGAGKTTVAALIPRFYDVTQGAIKIDGIDIRDCTLASLRRHIGIVPQDTVLFAGTLRDNIAYGRLGAPEADIIAAAKTANAWEFVEKLPEGLDTVIGERGVSLSGGQRQRIAIARAVLRDPKILILDEATSSLDTQSEALVQEALQRLVQDRTTLVIAHRLSTVRNADQILVLKEGRVVEAGRHEELLAEPGIYANLYYTQFRAAEDGLGRAPE
jgi:subfamily B ATP-binding cassette protein MsbA